MTLPEPAAAMLEGRELPGGWKVRKRISRPPTATGGRFSVGYVVQGPGDREAFLKALDYSAALQSDDPARELEAMTSAYNFERDVMRTCSQNGLSRIIRVLDDGKVDVQGAAIPTVSYLILEKADGDIRWFMSISRSFDEAWSLRTLHQAATALKQLHTHGIAHQDLKPSNVLLFSGGPAKLTDLGRASHQGRRAPHDGVRVAGDLGYAPLELLYGQRAAEWGESCAACDLYLLGSLATFLFADTVMTAALLAHLHPAQSPGNWGGSYAEILPYARAAFEEVMEEFEESVSPWLRESLSGIVRQLCEPDPGLRGHPRSRLGARSPYSLERFVTKFDLLARRAELNLGGASA